MFETWFAERANKVEQASNETGKDQPCSMQLHSSVGIVTVLQAGQPIIRGTIPGTGKRFLSSPNRPALEPPQTSYEMSAEGGLS
jgi:hypothetical protein